MRPGDRLQWRHHLRTRSSWRLAPSHPSGQSIVSLLEPSRVGVSIPGWWKGLANIFSIQIKILEGESSELSASLKISEECEKSLEFDGKYQEAPVFFKVEGLAHRVS